MNQYFPGNNLQPYCMKLKSQVKKMTLLKNVFNFSKNGLPLPLNKYNFKFNYSMKFNDVLE